jgi:hypothetical protein
MCGRVERGSATPHTPKKKKKKTLPSSLEALKPKILSHKN